MEWIKVSDRLPECSGKYTIKTVNRGVMMAIYDKDDKVFYDVTDDTVIFNVIAWARDKEEWETT